MTRRIRIVALPTATEKHERTVQRRVHGLGRARIVDGYIHHPGWRRLFWSQRPKGALALHLPAPWGKGGATRWFETDMGVLLEAKPVAPVETTRTPRVRVVTTSGGGGFGKQRLLFAKLRIVRCFSSLGHLND